MLWIGNPSTPAVREAMSDTRLGCILTPLQGQHAPEGSLWCSDNGCGPGSNGEEPGFRYVGDGNYLAFLQAELEREGADFCDPDTSGCLFAVAPDVLGDAAATLHRSATSGMLGWIRHVGYPVAFVAQNGQESLSLPWDDVDVLFLGGSPECVPCGWVKPWHAPRGLDRCPSCRGRLSEWKLGAGARRLVAEAIRHGKRVHMGRVNSLKRLAYAAAIGCDWADGTYLTRGPDVNLPKVIAWQLTVNTPRTQGDLFAGMETAA